MKDPAVVDIRDCGERLAQFDAIVDARSPSEYAEDRLPGAISAPVLDDAERARVGTIYTQRSPFEARRLGAALVSANIARMLQTTFADCDRDWRPLVYCWRGGNRSGALATVMARIGWRTSVLDGGYRAFRRYVVERLEQLPSQFQFVVIAGRTGSAKSRILQQLAAAGEQVLDLEALAAHRGSVLGGMPGAEQPSQKRFETELWRELASLRPQRPVFVEAESRKVGARQVPARLIESIRAARCVRIEADAQVRTRFLLDEYRHFVDAPESLYAQLDCLAPLHGAQRIAQWKSLAQRGDWPAFVETLLHEHYDPAYDRSMRGNFDRLDRADTVGLAAADAGAIAAAARVIADRFRSEAARDAARPANAPSAPPGT
ncbi:MAG TPA: tRNA 2-selenouridine(34) synthase MnmH [Burkholderiaceae bacterium]|nr:tRNA 2-selenouridine(34) synthase MnmH [Burkholderiaceae bacterium]